MFLPELFKLYLQIQRSSTLTVKNYVIDVNHFLSWLAQKTGIKHQIVGKAIFGLFTIETIGEYKQNLLQDRTPLSTINRRLSALRKFGQFGLKQGWLTENPAEKVANATLKQDVRWETQDEKILENFQKHLEKEKASPLTIKNYLSDLRHFLSWLEAS
jgi:site-specific recombinase XerD